MQIKAVVSWPKRNGKKRERSKQNASRAQTKVKRALARNGIVVEGLDKKSSATVRDTTVEV